MRTLNNVVVVLVAFVVAFGSIPVQAQGQIVGDTDSVRLARIRVLMSEEPSGSILNGSVLTLEPEHAGGRKQIRSTVGGGSAVRAWIGIGLMVVGAVHVYNIYKEQNNSTEDQAIAGGILAGGFLLWAY